MMNPQLEEVADRAMSEVVELMAGADAVPRDDQLVAVRALVAEDHVVNRRIIELMLAPLGVEVTLVANGAEAVEVAAARELEEECGYRAERMEALGVFHSSPGMTSEAFTLVRASGLTRVGEGGGVEGEGITVHRVALAELPAFVKVKRREGLAVDAKLLVVLAGALLGELT